MEVTHGDGVVQVGRVVHLLLRLVDGALLVNQIAVVGVVEFSFPLDGAAADDIGPVYIVNAGYEVGHIGRNGIAELADAVVPTQFQVPTPGGHVAGVGLGLAVTHHIGDFDIQEHVAGFLGVPVKVHFEAVVEERGVKAQVQRGSGFPADILHGQASLGGRLVGGDFGALVEEGVVKGHQRKVRIVVAADALVAQHTPAGAQFQEGQPVAGALHEGFLAQDPAGRYGREGPPAVGFGETGGTVVTNVGLDEVFSGVVVHDAAEEGVGSIFAAVTRVELVVFRTHVQVRILGELVKFTGGAQVFTLHDVALEAGHHAQVVFLAEAVMVVGQQLSRDIVTVVALLGEVIGRIDGSAALQPSAEDIRIVHHGIIAGKTEGLSLGVVDEGGDHGLQTQVLDGLELQGGLSTQLGAGGTVAAAGQKQTIRVGTALAFGNAAVVPSSGIDGRGLAHVGEGVVIGGKVGTMPHIDVQGGKELVLDDGEVVVGAQHETLEPATVIQGAHVIVGKGNLGADDLVAAADGYLMGVTRGKVFHHEGAPVRDGIVVRVGLVERDPVLDLVGRVLLEESGGGVVVVQQFVIHLQVAGQAHHVRFGRGNFNTEFPGVADGHVVDVAALGGNQDNAGGSLGTVNGCCGCVFQDRDALHIGRVHVIEAAHLDTVHDDERVAGADGGDTTDADAAGTRTRSGVVTGNHDAGEGALQGR